MQTVIFYILCLFVSFSYSLYEGDFCTTSGIKGICTNFDNCSEAQEKWTKNKERPQVCGFNRNDLIACCPIRRNPGVVSKEKCKEYSKYVYINKTIHSLLIDEPDIVVTKNECGIKVIPLISGGEEAVRKEFPHMGAIGYNTPEGIKYLCGGSLISEQFILTAAHCLEHNTFGKAQEVKLGATNLTHRFKVKDYKISEYIYHPDYKMTTSYHDIGLLKLEHVAEFNAYVRPTCLFTSDQIPTNKALTTGWGVEQWGGPTSNVLMKVVLDLLDVKECNQTFKSEIGRRFSKLRNGIIPEMFICAGSTGAKDACSGDSGGPLQIFHNSKDGVECMYDLIGVVSFGKPCGGDLARGGYTRISNYIQWIEDIVWPE